MEPYILFGLLLNRELNELKKNNTKYIGKVGTLRIIWYKTIVIDKVLFNILYFLKKEELISKERVNYGI